MFDYSLSIFLVLYTLNINDVSFSNFFVFYIYYQKSDVILWKFDLFLSCPKSTLSAFSQNNSFFQIINHLLITFGLFFTRMRLVAFMFIYILRRVILMIGKRLSRLTFKNLILMTKRRFKSILIWVLSLFSRTLNRIESDFGSILIFNFFREHWRLFFHLRELFNNFFTLCILISVI
jgi:hypothetical protein